MNGSRDEQEVDTLKCCGDWHHQPIRESEKSLQQGSFSFSFSSRSPRRVSLDDDEKSSFHGIEWSQFPVGSFADRKSHGTRPNSEASAQSSDQSASGKWEISDFTMKGVVGSGHYGVVRRTAYRHSKRKLAVKSFSKEKLLRDVHRNHGTALKLLQKELRIHSQLQNLHIVRLFGYFHCPESVHFVMDYARHGNLYSYIQEEENGIVDLSQAKLYLRQVSSALDYLRSRKIAHRDVKQENIIVTSKNTVQLCDFGCAVQYGIPGEQLRKTLCGTPLYCPPEMIAGSGTYDAEHVDSWALGVLAYELVLYESPFDVALSPKKHGMGESENGVSPSFRRSDRHAIFRKIRRYSNGSNIPEWCASQPKDFLSRLLRTEPGERMTAGQALHHSFLLDTEADAGPSPPTLLAHCKTPSLRYRNRPVCSSRRRKNPGGTKGLRDRSNFMLPLKRDPMDFNFDGSGPDHTCMAPMKRRRCH